MSKLIQHLAFLLIIRSFLLLLGIILPSVTFAIYLCILVLVIIVHLPRCETFQALLLPPISYALLQVLLLLVLLLVLLVLLLVLLVGQQARRTHGAALCTAQRNSMMAASCNPCLLLVPLLQQLRPLVWTSRWIQPLRVTCGA